MSDRYCAGCNVSRDCARRIGRNYLMRAGVLYCCAGCAEDDPALIDQTRAFALSPDADPTPDERKASQPELFPASLSDSYKPNRRPVTGDLFK